MTAVAATDQLSCGAQHAAGVLMGEAPTKNVKLLQFVEDAVSVCQPDSVVWADGTAGEYERLCHLILEAEAPVWVS